MKIVNKLIFNTALLILAIIVIYPLFFVVISSFKSNLDVITNPFLIKTFEIENYIEAWKIGKIGKYFLNSVFITGISILTQLIIVIFASYSFGKLKPYGYKVLFVLYLTGLFVTTEMITVPNFTTMKNLGILGTRLSLYLPYVTTGIALATFIATNFVKELPVEIDEAAKVDGCGVFRNLVLITVPLMKPVLATISIFNFQAVWSEFYWALIMIRDDKIKTLPLGLMNFQSQYNTDYGVLCAGLTISILPIIIIYLLCSSQFIGGMTSGAVKG